MKNTVRIKLTKKEIDAVFKKRNPKKWDKILDVYVFLIENLDRTDNPDISAEYQKKFNYFYQVRRNAEWRKRFYSLFSKYAKRRNADFGNILNTIHKETGMIEASFSSKFAATIDANLPLIDKHVLTYIDRKLPSSQQAPKDRIAAIIELHDNMKREFNSFLDTPHGRYLVARFTKEHNDKKISHMKMLDFVLWQSRGKKKIK